MNDLIKSFESVKEELQVDDTTAALLVLAEAVRRSATFNPVNAENFGHELALALKNVLKDGAIRIEVAE